MMDSLRAVMARSYCEAFDDCQCNCAVENKPLDRWCRGPVAGTDAALAAIEAAGTHCIAPLEPTLEQQISGVVAMAKALEPFIAKLRAEGRESDAITLSVISTGHITGPIYRAALAARPRDVERSEGDR